VSGDANDIQEKKRPPEKQAGNPQFWYTIVEKVGGWQVFLKKVGRNPQKQPGRRW
jgi:hypothetical protein